MQQFGGAWTERKLQCLRDYLEAYKKVMKNQPFRTVYIDAFAGTGYREIGTRDSKQFFQDLFAEDVEGFKHGSAKIALETTPPFDEYVFIENDPTKYHELLKMSEGYDQLRITVHNQDATPVIGQICSEDWIRQGRRGVIFLDPFGMSVDWSTLESIARTRALDVWILLPLGVAINRMLTRDGKIPAIWEAKLTMLFGTSEWQDVFYKEGGADAQLSLFTDVSQRKVEKSINFEGIAKFYNDRLRSIFAGVAKNPLMLRNSKNNPIYLLCFAASNERGAKPALRIAEHLLKSLT